MVAGRARVNPPARQGSYELRGEAMVFHRRWLRASASPRAAAENGRRGSG